MKTSKNLFVILLIVFFYSCSTKKVIISKDITETKIDSTYTEKKDSISVQQNFVIIKEKFFEIQIDPVDVSKPIIVDGVKYENVSLKIKKSDKSIVDSTKTTVVESFDKILELEKETFTEEFDKSLEKKSNYFVYFWLLLLLFLLAVAYKLRRLLPNPYSIISYICRTLKNQIK
jgi:type III secretory pathway lipoprotein EscJ